MANEFGGFIGPYMVIFSKPMDVVHEEYVCPNINCDTKTLRDDFEFCPKCGTKGEVILTTIPDKKTGLEILDELGMGEKFTCYGGMEDKDGNDIFISNKEDLGLLDISEETTGEIDFFPETGKSLFTPKEDMKKFKKIHAEDLQKLIDGGWEYKIKYGYVGYWS